MPDRPQPSSAGASVERQPDQVLDLRGLKCPLPALHTRRSLARAKAGAVVEVRCTDPLAALDIPNLVRELGDVLLLAMRNEGEMRFHIRKAGAPLECTGPPREDPSGDAGVDVTR